MPELFIFCFNYFLQQRKVIITRAHNLGHKLSYFADVAMFLQIERYLDRFFLFFSLVKKSNNKSSL